MRSFINTRRSSILICLIICLCVFLIQCIDRENKEQKVTSSKNIGFDQFAGSATCATCHKQIYDSFLNTGHFLTSQTASEKNIKGSFEKGSNVFNYRPGVSIKMEKSDSGFYQVEYINGKKKIVRRFDITIGSGTRGQTYLSWQGNLPTQLPISYLTSENTWANSPGDVNVYFDRPIDSRCLECHTTYAKVIPFRLQNTPEEFDHTKILYSIGCEKCHGPAAKHVEYQKENPKATIGKYIINPANFSRQQSLDLCSLCHGGRIKSTQPTFSFTSGDKLKDYFIVDTSAANASIDVHGNQLGLLKKSKCFKMSSLTCVTCHDSHKNERGNLTLYSQRCMTCHNEQHGTFCKVKADKATISSNCIDCHMPNEISKSIVLQLQDKKIPTAQLLRTHFITVYPDATKKFLLNKTITN